MLGGSVFIGGVLLGIIVGAVSGVLFAPRSGDDTRDLLCKQADELGETITGNGKRMIAKES
jgi:gas vesicle protein